MGGSEAGGNSFLSCKFSLVCTNAPAPGKKAINLGFVYALKHGGNPTLPVRYKARLVFRNHRFGTNSSWKDSFSPVVDKTTLRLFFTLVGRKQLFIRQADVVTAYLNAAIYSLHFKI